MRGSRACVLLDAQNLADRRLIFVDSIVSRSRAVDRRFARLDGRVIRLRASNCWACKAASLSLRFGLNRRYQR